MSDEKTEQNTEITKNVEEPPASPEITDEEIQSVEDHIQRLTAQLTALKERKRKQEPLTEESSKRLKIEDERDDTGNPAVEQNPYEYKPPSHTLNGSSSSEPPIEAGLYVSELPLTVTDEELRKAFSKFGRVYEATVVRHKPTQESKGFGFIRFHSLEEVQRVVSSQELPLFFDTLTQAMKPCRVKIADPKNVLSITNIPRSMPDHLIQSQLDIYTSIPSSKFETRCPSGQNNGQGWATYKDHPSALSALQRLQQNGCIIDGHLISGAMSLWESRQTTHDPHTHRPTLPVMDLSEVKNLFVKNVSPSATEPILRNFFGKGTAHGVERVVIPLDTVSRAHLGHAFLYFSDRRDAEIAKERCHGAELEGKRLEIEWSRPKPRGMGPMGRGRGAPMAAPPPYGYPPAAPAYGGYPYAYPYPAYPPAQTYPGAQAYPAGQAYPAQAYPGAQAYPSTQAHPAAQVHAAGQAYPSQAYPAAQAYSAAHTYPAATTTPSTTRTPMITTATAAEYSGAAKSQGYNAGYSNYYAGQRAAPTTGAQPSQYPYNYLH
ncbi:cuticular protein 47 precursor [Planoprotostelium fungivorum]|uniref:Cuticular protein 47 n=1 Tax=Planoprotostelium fungivorum TaxID=1890364 RepID=A0A2P6MYX9_9EUKA|nr:cuticular protein 47 precursor [Planoprotostelium fungivorum]